MADEPSPDGQEFAKLWSALWTNSIIFVVGIVVFSWRRTKDQDVYSPRTIYSTLPTPVIGDGLCAWISGILSVPEKHILENVGLDAVMFLRFMYMGLQLFGHACVFGLLCLVPLNIYGFDAAELDQVCVHESVGNMTVSTCTDATMVVDLEMLTLANVAPGSLYMIGHVVAIYLISLVAYYLLLKNYDQYTLMRHAYLADPEPHLYSVLVTNIPEDQRSSEEVADFFREIYPAEFYSAVITYNTGELAAKVILRNETRKKLEGALDVFEVTKERPEHKQKMCGLMGKKVDSIETFTEEVAQLDKDILALRAEEPKANPAAFVTFKTAMAATVVRQTFQTADPALWASAAAPAPSDVVWKNLSMPANAKKGRGLGISIALFFLVFFWAIPVVFISALSTLENLAKILPFLEPLLDLSPVLRGIIGGVLPTLALLIFMSVLLPKILKALAMQTGVVSFSEQQLKVGRQYYVFLVFNVFFVVLISASIFSALDALIDSPTSIVELMGTEIPKASTFFINYMLLQAMSVFPLSLAQISGLIASKVKKKFVFKTPKMERDGMHPLPFEYGMHLPRHLLIFMISFAYAAISPLILPFAALYFGVGYLVYRQQLIYVHITPYETGGSFWPIAFDRSIMAILVGQITVLGVFGLKLAPVPFALALPLPFLSVVFMRYCHEKFETPSNYMPMDAGAQVRNKTTGRVAGDTDSVVNMNGDFAFLDGVYDDPFIHTAEKSSDADHREEDKSKDGQVPSDEFEYSDEYSS